MIYQIYGTDAHTITKELVEAVCGYDKVSRKYNVPFFDLKQVMPLS